jgi:hypothetical protein
MIERNRKLPQSRYYLRAANYGIKKLAEVKPMDEGFLFYTAGIFASLRTVQHALINSDRKLSPQHMKVIDKWRKNTRMDGREIDFIKWGRDLILKGGAFPGYASSTEGSTGGKPYDTAYYRKRGTKLKRRDLIKDMRAASRWCDRQLSGIEAQVPKINLPGDTVEADD